MTSYDEVIKSGIIFRRPFRVLSNLFYVFKSGPKSGKPFMLKFESSTLCNLKCKMCPLHNGLSRDKGVLTFNNFKKVYDEISPPYLNLTGIGEPLLNPDLFKIVRYARKKGSLVKLDTNGTLLDDQNIQELINAKPNFISVSIDGVTKKKYESIRVGGNFETVVKNLRKLIEYRNEIKSKTKIHLFFVLQKDNVLELSNFIKFGEKIGVDAINGTLVIPMGENKNLDNMKISEKDILKLKRELSLLKRKNGIDLNIEGIENFLNKSEDNLKDKACFWPWYQASITWDGYVTPCCIFCDNEIVLGNVFKNSFMDIWNNLKYQKFREQLVKKRIGICKSCGVDESFIYDKLKIFYKIPLIRNLSNRK